MSGINPLDNIRKLGTTGQQDDKNKADGVSGFRKVSPTEPKRKTSNEKILNDFNSPLEKLAPQKITVKSVTDRNSFQEFISNKYREHEEIANKSAPRKAIGASQKNILSAIIYPCSYLANSALDSLSTAVFGNDRLTTNDKLSNTDKASLPQRALATIIFAGKASIALVAAILTIPVLLTATPIARLHTAFQNQQHAQNMTRHIFTSLLYKTFEKINIDGENKDFWQNMAKSFDKSTKNLSNIDINSITTQNALYKNDTKYKNIAGDKLYKVFIKITTDNLKGILKNIPKDKSGNSLKDILVNEIFDPEGRLKRDLQKTIKSTTKDLIKYTDQMELNTDKK